MRAINSKVKPASSMTIHPHCDNLETFERTCLETFTIVTERSYDVTYGSHNCGKWQQHKRDSI